MIEIFKKSKVFKKTIEKIRFDDLDILIDRKIEICESDFNETIKMINNKNIKAGDTIRITDPNKTTIIFKIRKNKKN